MQPTDAPDYPYRDALDIPGESGPEQVVPIPVSGVVGVVGPVYTRDKPPDYTSWTQQPFAGTTADTPTQLLPDDPMRRRAVIIAVGQAPAVLWLGSQTQCNVITAGGSTLGAGIPLPAGQQITITGRQAVWAISDLAHVITALVIGERDGGTAP